jgi:hypothetical protein
MEWIPQVDSCGVADLRTAELRSCGNGFLTMAEILKERGFHGADKIRAECLGFKCKLDAEDCCCRRLLYNQPDFTAVESIVKTTCKGRGFEAFFLPKFHCEVNCIEQCWGRAKRTYRMYPPSSKEDDLERNVTHALDSVPIESIRR